VRPTDRSGAKPNAPLGGVWSGRSSPWRRHGGSLIDLEARTPEGRAEVRTVPAFRLPMELKRAGERRRRKQERTGGDGGGHEDPVAPMLRTGLGRAGQVARLIRHGDLPGARLAGCGAPGSSWLYGDDRERSLSCPRSRLRPASRVAGHRSWPIGRCSAGRPSSGGMIENVISSFKLSLMNVSACEPRSVPPPGPWMGIPAAVGDPSPLTHPAEVGREATFAGIRILKVLHDGC
jgi:hypothetical protein